MNWRKPVIYGVLYLRGSKIPTYLREIKMFESLNSSQLETIRKEKLTKLLLHCYDNVPYYTKVLRESRVIDENRQINRRVQFTVLKK